MRAPSPLIAREYSDVSAVFEENPLDTTVWECFLERTEVTNHERGHDNDARRLAIFFGMLPIVLLDLPPLNYIRIGSTY